MKIDKTFAEGWNLLGLGYFGISLILSIVSLFIPRFYIFAKFSLYLSALAIIIGVVGGIIFGYLDSKEEKEKKK